MQICMSVFYLLLEVRDQFRSSIQTLHVHNGPWAAFMFCINTYLADLWVLLMLLYFYLLCGLVSHTFYFCLAFELSTC